VGQQGWPIFDCTGDPMTIDAAINKLIHPSVILEFNLLSYRLESPQSHWTEHRTDHR
jgi:hypothetical protein